MKLMKCNPPSVESRAGHRTRRLRVGTVADPPDKPEMNIGDLWNWEVGMRKSEILDEIQMFHFLPCAETRMPDALCESSYTLHL